MRYGHDVPPPIGRVAQLYMAGVPVGDHEVSGIDWQMPGRAMQPITTIMPVRQCGHWCSAPSQGFVTVAVVGRWLGRRSWCHPEQFPAELKLPRPMAIAEEAVSTGCDETHPAAHGS